MNGILELMALLEAVVILVLTIILIRTWGKIDPTHPIKNKPTYIAIWTFNPYKWRAYDTEARQLWRWEGNWVADYETEIHHVPEPR